MTITASYLLVYASHRDKLWLPEDWNAGLYKLLVSFVGSHASDEEYLEIQSFSPAPSRQPRCLCPWW